MGLGGEWASTTMGLYGRNTSAPLFAFMQSRILGRGGFNPGVREEPGSAAVVQAVSRDRGGVGLGGIGYATRGVRVVPVGEGGLAPAEPSEENIQSGRYPLSHPLWIYFCKDPTRGTDAVVRAFLEFVLSKDGREIAAKRGMVPPSEATAAEESAQSR